MLRFLVDIEDARANIHTVVTLPTAGGIGNATPQGALTIMENDGKPIGFINAEELTAFRTALASSLLMSRRSKIKTVTVFGAGKQAYVSLFLLFIFSLNTSLNYIFHYTLVYFTNTSQILARPSRTALTRALDPARVHDNAVI